MQGDSLSSREAATHTRGIAYAGPGMRDKADGGIGETGAKRRDGQAVSRTRSLHAMPAIADSRQAAPGAAQSSEAEK